MWIALAVIVSLFILLIVMNPKIKNTTRDERMLRMNLENSSSYQQRTNHAEPEGAIMPPVVGVESKYRVNLHQAYIT